MNEIEEIKRRKLEELRAKFQQQHQEDTEAQQQFAQVETAVKQLFTKEALARYGNIKTAHQEKALQLIVVLAQLLQSGRIKQKIDDSTLKSILSRLTGEKRETKIIRK